MSLISKVKELEYTVEQDILVMRDVIQLIEIPRRLIRGEEEVVILVNKHTLDDMAWKKRIREIISNHDLGYVIHEDIDTDLLMYTFKYRR